MLKQYKAIKKDKTVKSEHRLIMESILGRELRTDEIVHHIDGDKWNNNPSNLMIVTREEHARIHYDDINRSKAVAQCDLEGVILKIWPSAREAERNTSVAFQNIFKCCRGKRKTAGGYVWKYAE